jgi:hypothetical protein
MGTTTKVISMKSRKEAQQEHHQHHHRERAEYAAGHGFERVAHALISAEFTEHQGEQARADQDDEYHRADLRGGLHHGVEHSGSVQAHEGEDSARGGER